MSATAIPQILLTGATGFIGGTILTTLLSSQSPALRSAPITCLIRGADRAALLSSMYGERVRPVLYNDLDDIETTIKVASAHDIVISTTLGFHPASAQALLKGLSQRRAATKRPVWFIHTSGASNLSDQAISGVYIHDPPDREFDDLKDDIYAIEKELEALYPYQQRSTELGVIDTGIELGVNTIVMMAPLIYGKGTGLFNKISVQIPTYTRGALAHGQVVVIDGGKGVIHHVHVEDLAELYKIVALKILADGGEGLPVDKEGIMFSGVGTHSWLDVGEGIAEVLFEKGKVAERGVHSVGLEEGTKIFSFLGTVEEDLVERGLAGNAQTVASLAKRLGWTPVRGERDWQRGFRDDVEAVLSQTDK